MNTDDINDFGTDPDFDDYKEEYLNVKKESQANLVLKKKCWMTASGTILRVSEIDEKHLRNIIGLLERKAIFTDELQKKVLKDMKAELNDRLYFNS